MTDTVYGDASLSDLEFSQITQVILDGIESQLDAWLQSDIIDIDASRSGGVLELTFPDRSKIVINTQPPMRELWLASKAGGFHFRWAHKKWIDTKSGDDFFHVLSRSASEQGRLTLTFASP